MSEITWIIIAGAILTYLTRIGGHLVLSRFEHVHPRVEAGLDAVPAAVLTTLVAPAAMDGGPIELTARDALVELGYTLVEAEQALATVDPELPVEERVREALRSAA